MQKLLTWAFTPVLALAFFVLGTPAANAFGTEVLGCQFGSASWTANTCGPGLGVVTFSPNNLSGAYTYGWSVTHDGAPVTNICSSTTGAPCIYGGCTATSSTCDIRTAGSTFSQRTVVATLVLTQSGQSRTIQATATVERVRPCINGC
jgi:hypothetical protein